jgi:hemoglobin/transferrin/lactoferrin receptor protein
MRHVVAVVALVVVLLPNAYGQEEKKKTDDSKSDDSKSKVVEKITVTATRFERPIDLTPQSVTVVDAEEIAARPMTNVQSILEDVPGISYSRTGALDGQLTVRGLSSNDSRLVLFIDGDRFRGRPSLEYSFLDPNEIERIEIIRGPAAALYGSDAMNGVVNVITRRAHPDPASPNFSLHPRLYAVGYSSANNLAATRLELQGASSKFDLLVGGNYRHANDYGTPVGTIPNSDMETRSLNVRAGYAPTDTARLEVDTKIMVIEAGRATAPGAPLVTTRQTPLRERSARLAYTQSQVASWMQDLEVSAYARYMHTVIRSDTRTAANGNEELRDTWVIGPTVTGGKLLARSILGDSVLAYGVDVYREDVPPFDDEVRVLNSAGTQVSFSPRAPRIRPVVQTDLGALAHYDWDPTQRWTMSLGSRYDVVWTDIDPTPALGESPELSAAFARNRSSRDNKVTGSAGLIFRPASMLHLVANVSTAFRSPTTFDKSGSGTVGVLNTLPNAELKPESSENYEGGARLRLKNWNVNLTAFRSDYEDLLQYVFLTPLTRQRQNVGRARIQGLEIDGTVAMTPNWAWRFNAANVRGTNKLTNAPLPYVPPLNGLLALRRTAPGDKWWIEATGRWSQDKTRIDRTQERPTDGYQVFGVYAGTNLYRFGKTLAPYRLTVGIDNITDERYVNPVTRELIGFPVSPTNPLIEPGRSLTINLTAAF